MWSIKSAMSGSKPPSPIDTLSNRYSHSDDRFSPQLAAHATADQGRETRRLSVVSDCFSTAETEDNGLDDEEVSEYIDLAVSLMGECKTELSFVNLDRAISLFRQVLYRLPITHPLHVDALSDLASALGIRFLYTNQRTDLEQLWHIRGEIEKSITKNQDASNANVSFRKQDIIDSQHYHDVAKRRLADFQKSTPLHALNTIVFLLQISLAHLPPAHPARFEAVMTRADGSYGRFLHSYDINDINDAISSLNDAVDCCTAVDPMLRANIRHRCSVMLRTRFDLNGNILDMEQASKHLLQALSEEAGTHGGHILTLQVANELFQRASQSENMNGLNAAVTLMRDGVAGLPASHKDYLPALLNLGTALTARFEKGGQRTDLEELIALLRQGLDLTESIHPLRPAALNKLANTLFTRFVQQGLPSDLDETILLGKQVLELTPPEHPLRLASLRNLANAVFAKFRQSGQRSDLDDAILFSIKAIELGPQPHPDEYMSLIVLADALLNRFEKWSQHGDLTESVSLYRKAIKLLPPSHSEGYSLDGLAKALYIGFTNGGHLGDLDEAISLHRQALDLHAAPHPQRSSSMEHLARVLMVRFQQGGQPTSDLDEAVSLFKQALDLCPPHHSRLSTITSDLGLSLFTRFQQGGQPGDLSEAILLHRRALELRPSPHPDRFGSLVNLAAAVRVRFNRGSGSYAGDVDEIISLLREALELCPAPHPRRYTSLAGLASALLIRFEQGGQTSDLAESISLDRQAIELLPPHHLARSACLDILARLLLTQFQQTGDRRDLDESILLSREVLELDSLVHLNRSSPLTNLANSLSTRFHQAGQPSDLEEAILLYKQALKLVSPPHPGRADALLNLASSIFMRFVRGRQSRDLVEAISLYREALDLAPLSHPNLSFFINNLADALTLRFKQGNLPDDITEAISLHRRALELRPPPHPDRSLSLHNLATALEAKYTQGAEHSALDEVILLSRQALELRPEPHPARASSLRQLGNTLSLVHSLTSGHSDYLEESMYLLSAATKCPSQSAVQRLNSAKAWIQKAESFQHISAMKAYDAALWTLPHVAALSFDIESRQNVLSTLSDGLARDASRCAIRSGNLDKAIEFLESGRSIFWSQLLSLRSPIDQLRDVAPEMADKIQIISTALELGSHRDISADILDNQKKLSLDKEMARLNRLNEEWSMAIDKVRKIDGFADFLQPRRLSSLQAAASKSPVVFLVDNDDGSHCLIMKSTTVHHIPIPKLPTAILKALVLLVQAAVSHLPISRSVVDRARSVMIEVLGENRGMRFHTDYLPSSDEVFRVVLRILWDEVVSRVINFLQIQKSRETSHLQWCATGLFTFLPVHAAGCYDGDSPTECASDYFISSYTPTVSALLTPNPAPSPEQPKVMVVIQSAELPHTKKELENIKRHVSTDGLLTFGVPGAPASIEDVASCLSDASIVHFACHGTQDRTKPLNSGLVLKDGLLKVSRIMKEKMPNGSLAFLCACETAMGDENIPDEAMSLGASLLFSGFRRVIATMWQMADEDGPTLADAFYEEIFQGPDGNPAIHPNIGQSARALHIAVQKLRSNDVPFRRWVPFIHIGQ